MTLVRGGGGARGECSLRPSPWLSLSTALALGSTRTAQDGDRGRGDPTPGEVEGQVRSLVPEPGRGRHQGGTVEVGARFVIVVVVVGVVVVDAGYGHDGGAEDERG